MRLKKLAKVRVEPKLKGKHEWLWVEVGEEGIDGVGKEESRRRRRELGRKSREREQRKSEIEKVRSKQGLVRR